MRTEEEVNLMIESMMKRTKGKYLTQGVSFNKECPRQMALLKKALMHSVSFSGLIKELLTIFFNSSNLKQNSQNICDNYGNVAVLPQKNEFSHENNTKIEENKENFEKNTKKSKNTGNFL